MNDLTIVTGIWDLGREKAGEGFQRSFDHYRAKFAELLKAEVPMVVYGDEAMRAFVLEARRDLPTDFHVKPADAFRTDFPFYDRVQEIRQDPRWREQVGWLPASPQATLDLYNPMVMSKMFMLNDASIWNPFGTDHFAWIDGAITNTVHPGYFTHDHVFRKVSPLLEQFFFVSFPYVDGPEVHGFTRAGMTRYCRTDPQYVCRGGFFGGHRECLHDVNGQYYQLLSATLHEGLMGTEESLFTIMAYEEPELYQRFELQEDHGALLQHFFEHVKGLPIVSGVDAEPRKAPITRSRRRDPDISGARIAGYVVTYNAPDQLSGVLKSWTSEFRFDSLYILDHSTDRVAREENCAIADQHGATILYHPKGNGGICGGRQFVAEHFDSIDADFCLFLEDDMFLNPASMAGVCRNGFRLSIPDLRDVVLKIMMIEDYDFLKLSFTEFYGDNRRQWAWYNVPQDVRQRRWPDKSRLPTYGLDPDSPTTMFEHINSVRSVAYADGEVYYCNWPQVVSREGNRRMFLETTWAAPFEQTWMSHFFQLTLAGRLHPAVLLASVITHDRFHHYTAAERREN